MTKTPTILAIESAVVGGSIALALGQTIIDTWIGEGGVSRAEDLLWNIDQILKRNAVNKRELTQLVVSIGPGSFTGIRIGLATAMGIASSLHIPLAKYSILHAMTAGSNGDDNIATAVPVGRGVVCIQSFRRVAGLVKFDSEPVAVSADEDNSKAASRNIITMGNFPRGLAACLIDAVHDPDVPLMSEPLFISKPAHL